MKFRKTLLCLTAAAAMSATMAFGQVTADSIVSDFQSQGYTRIEIKVGLTQIKVEAIRDATKVEIIYDIATGAILKQEIEAVRPGEDTAPGVSIRIRNRDFLGGHGGDDDGDHDGDAGQVNDDFDDDDDDDDDDSGHRSGSNSGHG